MRILAAYIFIDQREPNFPIKRAFEHYTDEYEEIDWISVESKHGTEYMKQHFIDRVKDYNPDIFFMALQHPRLMDVNVARELAKHTKVINWTGDVRHQPDYMNWYVDIGKEIFLTLFTNNSQVDYLKEHGVYNVDYLQIGYDDKLYDTRYVDDNPSQITFCANYYAHESFPLTEFRRSAAIGLKSNFNQFRLFGNGWSHPFNTHSINMSQESAEYNNSAIGINISHYDYKNYSSDRLFRIMGTGAMVLSHHYQNIEDDFDIGNELDTFKSIPELISKTRFYLDNPIERKRIAHNGYKHAHSKCTWEYRINELLTLIDKHA